jgi:shikimate dehydrogenase
MNDSRETLPDAAALAAACVIGYPIRHSRSPMIHGYWLEKLGIAGSYTAREISVAAFPAFIAAIKDGSAQLRGGNVTIPHKETAFALADAPDELASELGASNTLWMDDGLLKATNTDGHGFVANLDERHPGWDKHKNRAVVYGAGGASRAIVQAVRNCGFSEIHVLNRTLSRAQELADRFGPRVHAHPLEAFQEVSTGANLFVNTTSLGMEGEPAPHLDFTRFAEDAVMTDIVYVPLMTPFLKQAVEQGRPVVDGLGMLLHQAVPGFALWFGQRPQVDDRLRQMIIADMERHA